jgi:hypothetical protein
MEKRKNIVVVGSKNPIKIDCARRSFKKLLGDEKVIDGETFEFLGVDVPSGVSDQPKSDEETLKGATNRARNAFLQKRDADYWFGVEGGIEERKETKELEAFAWIVVLSKQEGVGTPSPSSPTRIEIEGQYFIFGKGTFSNLLLSTLDLLSSPLLSSPSLPLLSSRTHLLSIFPFFLSYSPLSQLEQQRSSFQNECQS